MKVLVRRKFLVPIERRHDVQLMSNRLWHINCSITMEDMYRSWIDYSNSMAACWIAPPLAPEDILRNIEPYLMVIDD